MGKKHDDRPDSRRSPILVGAASIASGVAFGWCCEKARVFDPAVVLSQFAFADWTMAKMFFAAAGASSASFSVLSMVFPDTFAEARRYTIAGPPAMKTLLIGGLLYGCGMVVSGVCTGMLYAQLGSMTVNSFWSLAGAIAGTYLFNVADPLLAKHKGECNAKATTLDRVCGVPYWCFGLAFSAAMAGGVVILESNFPWTQSPVYKALGGVKDVADPINIHNPLWPSYIPGMIVGCLQMPLAVFAGKTLGSASALCTVVGAGQKYDDATPRFKATHITRGMDSLWQVMYAVGAVAGGYMSASAGGTLGAASTEPLKAFLGTATVLFSAHLCGGCTAGHGLSGMPLLSPESFVTVAMFCVGGGLAALCMM
eukprot:GFYU01004891.1.p1 GENE.GFYU01004891.1~~GFYU01004891.1.p1  ORF type:complete len:402 (+),score=77.61 GFYU01004891.1:104-1207(+)